MKLVGRYLSPFVRRVGTSLIHLGLPFEHATLSVVDHKADIAALNPLIRVPALVLDDGTSLIDSNAILDTIDQMVGPEKALVPATGVARRDVMQLVAFAHGACEKTVSAYYELTRRPKEFCYPAWADQCERQALSALAVLDEAAKGRIYLIGDRLTQADISAVVAYDFQRHVLPETVPHGKFPALEAFSAHWNQTEAFKATSPAAK